MFKKFLGDLLGGNDENKKKTNEQEEINARKDDANEYEDDEEEEEEEEDDDNYYDDGRESASADVELDPETLHGKHYTVEQFDNEVERRVKEWTAAEKADGENPDDRDINNYRFNIRRDVYKEWTGANMNQMMQWENRNSMKHTGVASFGSEQHDENNPLLAPIHGISLQDYGAIASKLASGVKIEAVCKALNIETPVWEEVNTLWVKRMQEDGTFTVTNIFSRYFGEADKHPVLGNLGADYDDQAKVNVDKIHSDRYFYEELCGARQAAYEYGMDGAQWILENFGIPLGEFQNAAVKWMQEQNLNFDAGKITHFANYQQEKQEEYAKRFAAEQGGNIADDVEF